MLRGFGAIDAGSLLMNLSGYRLITMIQESFERQVHVGSFDAEATCYCCGVSTTQIQTESVQQGRGPECRR